MKQSGTVGSGLGRRAIPVLALAGAGLAGFGWAFAARGASVGAVVCFAGLGAALAAIAFLGWRGADRARDEIKSLERRLARLEAEKQDLDVFVHASTHDLHEPLRKIQAFGDRLRDQLGLMADPAAIRSLDRMTAAAERLRRLLDALLIHARVRDDRTRIETVDLGATLAAILADRAADIDAAGAEIEVSGLDAIEGDAGQIRTLLENIIDNALKYRRLDANVIIQVAGRDDAGGDEGRIVIEVTDNGIGFEPRHADRIFGLFERLHSRDVYEGAGVGLATSRKIAERHGGSLSARGEPGAGACFTLILPRRQASLSSDPAGNG